MSLFDTLQVGTRIENEQYLRKHPEVAALISSFVRYVQILVDVTSNFSLSQFQVWSMLTKWDLKLTKWELTNGWEDTILIAVCEHRRVHVVPYHICSDALLKRPENIQEFASGMLNRRIAWSWCMCM